MKHNQYAIKRVKSGLYCVMVNGRTVGAIGRDPSLQAKPGTWYTYHTGSSMTARGLPTKKCALYTLLAMIADTEWLEGATLRRYECPQKERA